MNTINMINKCKVMIGRCLFLLISLISVGGLLIHCSANPAAPPTPPAELPTFLVLPNPTLDVSKISSNASAGLAALVGSGGELSEEIAIAPNEIGDAALSLTAVLNQFDEFTIPVNRDPNVSLPVTDSVGTARTVKIDFADYDYDGDGVLEGCSGHTAALPICMRLWVDNERIAQAVFEHFPTQDNQGSGRIKYVVPSGGGDSGVRISTIYDFFDPENRSSEFLLFTPPESFARSYRRAIITAVGPESSAKKSIKFSKSFFFDSSPTADTIQYVASFLEGNQPTQDFWSGSLQVSTDLLEESPGLSNISGACAQISTGNPVLVGTCQDLEIDVTGADFIDFATDADFALNSFPENPTF